MNELHTNDEPQRILLEASERIKACYPPGTRIEMQLGNGGIRAGTVAYIGFGRFVFQEDDYPGYTYPFHPALDPHRVLP